MLRNLPGVTKNLLYINILMFVATYLLGDQLFPLFANEHAEQLREQLPRAGSLNLVFGLFYFDSPLFMPHQVVTHMFMHGGVFHILINMFMLVMFGSLLERLWGPQRFFIFYFFTGFGALILHQAVQAYEIYELAGTISFGPDSLAELQSSGGQDLVRNYIIPTVGASGAIYGLLIAFGYLFPNTELMFLLIPVPIKAKYLIPVLVLFELYLGITGMRGGTNIAHFAHLGGALFGFILLKYWQRDRGSFY
jgi:rhomboid-like protein